MKRCNCLNVNQLLIDGTRHACTIDSLQFRISIPELIRGTLYFITIDQASVTYENTEEPKFQTITIH